MKKIFSFLMIILCSFGFSMGKAENEEILFRGLPWGCNPQALEENVGTNLNEPYISHLDLWSRWNEPYFGTSDISKYDAGYMVLASEPNITVAGYNIFTLTAEFVFDISKNGQLDRNVDSSHLIEAEYTIRSEDNEKAYEDLKSKLSSLYGDYSVENEYTIIWKGKNKTAVRLMKSSSLIYIKYGKEDMEDQIHQVDETIHQEQLNKEDRNREENASNTDGL